MAQPGAGPDGGPAAHPRSLPATQPPDPKIQADIDLGLYEKVCRGNLEEVKRLLSGNPRPNLESKHDKREETALHAACRYSSTLDCAIQLIGAGAKLNTPDGEGNTALHLAAREEHLDIVQFLVSKAEDMDHLAYRVEDSQHLVDPVERKKYIVNLPNNSGKTALHQAAQTNKLDIIEFLIKSGASTTLRDSDGLTAALYACSRPGTGAMRKLLEKDRTKINDQADDTDNGKKQTCLHRLCAANNVFADPGDDIEWLLDQGADPTIKDAHGKTAWELCYGLGDRTGLVSEAVGVFAIKELEHILNKFKGITIESHFFGSENDPIIPLHRSGFNIRGAIPAGSWFHVNGNNRLWISGLLRAISEQNPHISPRSYPPIHRLVARHFLECQESADHLAFREPSCSFERLETIQDKSEAPKGPSKPAFMSLVMPCFHSHLYSNLEQRRKEYSKFTEGLRYCCGSSSNIASKRTFGLHLPLTLDEYCNPALSEKTLHGRNRDQVLVRYERYKKLDKEEKERQETRDGQIEKERGMQEEKGENEVPPPAKLLTVQQAWVWNINDNVITAFSKNLIERDLVISFDYLCDFGLPFHAVGLLLSLLVDTLDRPVMAGLSEPIFNIFEKSISTLSEQVNQYLEVLDVEAMQIQKEKQYFHEIGDIREELSMINSVLFQQEEVWKEFVSSVWPEHWKDGRFIIPSTDVSPGAGWWQRIVRPQTQFAKFRRRLEKIDDDAQRVENSISKSLDLKAKHASIREAHSTAIMSSAVFGFTIITIIFTPLSFVVSLFALPIDRFQRHQIESRWTNETGMYTTNYVGKFIATTEIVSVTLTLVAMWLSIELGLKRGRNLKRLQKYVNRLWKLALESKRPNPVAGAAQNSSVRATASDSNAEKSTNEPDQKVEETQWWRFGRRRRRQDNTC